MKKNHAPGNSRKDEKVLYMKNYNIRRKQYKVHSDLSSSGMKSKIDFKHRSTNAEITFTISQANLKRSPENIQG